MSTVFLIARIVFSAMFVMSGINHITKANDMTGYAQFKGVPSPKLAVIGSGVVMGLGGLSLILGVYADLGAIVLAAILLLMAVKMHNFWTLEDAQAKQADMISRQMEAMCSFLSGPGLALVILSMTCATRSGRKKGEPSARLISPTFSATLARWFSKLKSC